MKHFLSYLVIILAIIDTNPIWADVPSGAAYLDGGGSKYGLILCHGRGKYPTWKVVDPLRKGVNEKLGYHTLSIQMPNADKNWKDYADDFPEAYSRIRNAILYLKQEKGVEKIFLMGHSMGSRMASAFMAKDNDQLINGLILAGCRNNGGGVLNCKSNVVDLALPVLDIWGGGEKKDVKAANERQSLQSKTYTQINIPNADHRFDGHEDEFVNAVTQWLTQL